jgi:transglutaminase-like putative cysteine protease
MRLISAPFSVISGIVFCLCFNPVLASLCYSQTGSGIAEYNTRVVFDGKTLKTEVSYLIAIADHSADYLTEISIDYDQNTDLDITEAMVIGKNGAILRKLTKKEIVTRSDISDGALFEDDMVKEFTLRWNEYPYYIKYSYRKTYSRFISLAFWTPLVYRNTAVQSASLSVELPHNLKYRYQSRGNLVFSTDSLEKALLLKWTSGPIGPHGAENYQPNEFEFIPYVEVIPDKFKYGVDGSLTDWASYGQWQEKILSGLLSLPEQETRIIDKLIEGVSDKREIAKILYHYLQDNTRYINVAVDEGGLIPYPASYVCANRYGDCKALTVYMMALLRYAGIKSYYTIIYAGEKPYPVNSDFPSPRFNHVMLCLPLDGDTVWLENTNSLLPFGYSGTQTAGRYCLIVDGEKSRLVMKPPVLPEDVLVSSVYRVSADNSGSGTVRLIKHLRGQEFTKYLQVKNDITDQEREEIIRDDTGLKNEIVSFEINHRNRDTASIEIVAELKVPSVLRKVGTSLAFGLPSGRILRLEKPSERTRPVRINTPVFIKDSIYISTSNLQGYIPRLPVNADVKSEFGYCSVRYSSDRENIIIVRELLLRSGTVEPDKYSRLYDFVENVRETMRKTGLIFNIKQ